MRRSAVMAAFVAMATAGPALAVQDPQGSRFDSRVRTVAYNPMNVVRVIGGTFSSTQVIFAPQEAITQVAIGDSDAWLAQPAGNLLFLKPVEARAPTNMQVVTKRPDRSLRSYQFEMTARNAMGDQPAAGAVFAVVFTYPDDARQAALADRERNAAASDERMAQDRLAWDFLSGPRNWRYTAQGSTAIQPTEVSDNGRVTAFRFPGNSPVPTIYSIAADGQESIVPYTVRDEMVVVSVTAPEFRLRLGDEVIRVFNRGYNPTGLSFQTGTTSPEIVRHVRPVRRRVR
jgi:type IV secretion system protein VirB9